ncbi:MAG: hypothetical protein ACRD8O_01580 [Bryobacteraceae bacterium]
MVKRFERAKDSLRRKVSLRLRFQADADFNNSAVPAIRRTWPPINLRAAQGLLADGVPDKDILAIAAKQRRVVLTHDVSTMPQLWLRWKPADLVNSIRWPLLFAYANDHSLTVVAQKPMPRRDREGADTQLFMTLCLARRTAAGAMIARGKPYARDLTRRFGEPRAW